MTLKVKGTLLNQPQDFAILKKKKEKERKYHIIFSLFRHYLHTPWKLGSNS